MSARSGTMGILLLVTFSFALRLPTLGGVNFSPDAAEYAGIARRFAEGQGLTTAIKWHFLDKGPVVRPAAVERPILYPLFGSAVLRLTGTAEPLRALQAANAGISALNALLALATFRTVASGPAAQAGAALLALSRPMTESATLALSEQLFLALWLAALLLLPRLARPGSAALFGILAGLASMTRPNGVLLLLAPALLLRHQRSRRSLAYALGSGLLLLAAYSTYARAACAPDMRPGALVNFAVLHIHEATWDGFGREIPSPPAFIAAHAPQVAAAVARKLHANLGALWLALGPLWLLLLLRPPRTPPTAGGAEPRLRRVWLTLAAANFTFYSLAWVAAGAMRYLLPTTAMALPLLLDRGFAAAGKSREARALLAVALLAAAAMMGAHWSMHARKCRRQWKPDGWSRYRLAADWLEDATGPNDVVASNNPWLVNLLTRRPTVACPNFGPDADLDTFARRFDVRWVVLFTGSNDPRVRRCKSYPGARLARRHPTAYLFAIRPPTLSLEP